jgi:predicted molibdopterin-dependent oxidoreductase YjgC
MTGRILRLAETGRAPVVFHFDGRAVSGLQGDTVLTAVLSHNKVLRDAEFGPEARAGFCLMGACQDCWVWDEDGNRLRACSTEVRDGMRLRSSAPEGWPA